MMDSEKEVRMGRRRLMILIPETEFERLRRLADFEGRTPVQQARWLLCQSLSPHQDRSETEVTDECDR